ncbi:potassium-transporting ATPase subunit KdpA [Cutibacterium avidum]|uniref:Potassium-transporting ATPase potassium-binding subunit n=1 Tax=Cutibacterium avidum ATCC 25577 TaxID=997355 RepID=G4CX92_9ACTN|nr:potassium-transporting ATPase subunit KdpA [Cutibacterium avidum]EGY77606.1 potassium-transporting ATPase subunit A [Cutibacterium avidum ATCC 25577]MCO6632023.1 potassium-transporting ATPase subunit KdpA [Cutibacterium avidum]MCO6661881.1 potassium-transporting ATPase subunit KdpA [Cutibacterium avidum]MCO6666282.1 potassium-transporting ATPase subunit KdpA [Cutibacterium avidum]MCO6678628.1 potassium-transporting ATPase subunit KdpA [Cutibacterium avidum]
MTWFYFLASLALLALALGIAQHHLGSYMARVFTSDKDTKVEAFCYRIMGVDPRAGQTWKSYARSVLAFSFCGVVLLYALQRLQSWLPWSMDKGSVNPAVAFNTAVSFVTNTNWQAYSPEATLGHFVQLAGLCVQNFVSAATGIAVAIALVRGFVGRGEHTIGNFWVDLTRTTLRILMPIAAVGAFLLIVGGAAQNFIGFMHVTGIAGGDQIIPGGPVASQEVIKELGTNGGGFFNGNSSHPFENPQPWTNMLEIFLILLIPFSLPRTFGKMVKDVRQGRAILISMIVLFLINLFAMAAAEFSGHGTAGRLAGAAMEGKEQRFGLIQSVLFANATTMTSTGAVNSMHDSYTAIGGMFTMLNMMLGEISPGGVGSGLYGMLVIAVIAVFIAGLLVGRTPEYLGKKIGPREMKLSALYILVMPALVLCGVALSLAIPGIRDGVVNTSISNPGEHGLSELVYAFTSGANNNGSAFAGLDASTNWLCAAIGVAMLLGRFLPIILALALAGALAEREPVPVTAGTLPTHNALFITLVVFTAILVTALVFFPVLTLGPLAEGLI